MRNVTECQHVSNATKRDAGKRTQKMFSTNGAGVVNGKYAALLVRVKLQGQQL